MIPELLGQKVAIITLKMFKKGKVIVSMK